MPVAVEVDEAANSDMSTKEKLLLLKDKAKIKATHALHIRVSDVEEDAVRTPHEAALQEINESPGFNPSSFLNRARIGPAGSPDKGIAFIQGTADAILHPKTTIKQKPHKRLRRSWPRAGHTCHVKQTWTFWKPTIICDEQKALGTIATMTRQLPAKMETWMNVRSILTTWS